MCVVVLPDVVSLHTCDEAGDQQGQDQHLEHSHEQFPWEGEVLHLAVRQVERAHGKAQDYTWKTNDSFVHVLLELYSCIHRHQPEIFIISIPHRRNCHDRVMIIL